MTSNSDKLRSLILAALMVFSVFAGTVALTGSAAAVGGNTSGAPSVQSATHYVGNSGPVVEVAFDEQIQAGSATITVTLEDGSTPINGASVSASQINGGQLKVSTGSVPGGVYNNVDTVTVTDIEDQESNTATVTEDVVFASAPADTGTDGDEFEAYRGENVSVYDDTNLETSFDIEGDDVNYDVVRGTGNNSEVYVWNTTSRELGDYNISAQGNSAEVTLTLQDLGLSVEADETSFEDDENVTATVEMGDINRPVSVRLIDDSDDTVAYVNESTNSEGELEASFPEQGDGNYTVEVEDLNSGITATSDEFEVVDAGDAETQFAQSVYEQERGDVVNISIEYSNSDTATVQVGDRDDDNYALTAEVVDDDEDGVAYVEFNSFTAGNGTNAVLTAGDDDTIVNNVNQSGTFNGSNDPLGSDILASSSYELTTATGSYDGSGVLTDEDNVATLSLNERSTENAQVWTAPEDTFGDLTSSSTEATDIPDFVEAGNLTQTSSVADGDTIVVQVDASGLEGALDQDDLTGSYTTASGNANLFSLIVEEGEAGANADPENVNVTSLNDIGVLYNDEADTHYVVLNSSEVKNDIGGYEDGDSYTANFTVFGGADNNDLADDNESVEDSFNIEDRDVEFDQNDDDEIEVGAAASQEVTGTTNLAPGTELTIRMRSDTDGSPFLKQPETTVQADGSFSATADFSDTSPGATFDVRARLGGTNIGSEVDGVVTEATATATPEPTETATPEPTETATPEPTDEPEPTETAMDTATEPAGTTTGDSGPGFTAAIALIALVAAALLAVRRDN